LVIRKTTVLRIFKDSAIIHDGFLQSFFNKSATAAMFTPERFDFGRPTLSSSSARSLPFRNRKYQLKHLISFP
jgi:hypothetical protein